MREIYRVDSRQTGELVFAGAWPDAKQCWSNQVELLEKGRHPAKTLQNHFDKYGLTDLEMSVVKKVNSEDELNQVFGKMPLKKVIIPNPAQTEKPTIPEVVAEVALLTVDLEKELPTVEKNVVKKTRKKRTKK